MVELTAAVGGVSSRVWVSNVLIATLPHSSAVSSQSIDDGTAMTVTPQGLNDEGTSSARTAADASVAVAATGVIFSCTPARSDAAVVKIHGDIDMRSAPILADYVCSRVETGRLLVFDLSVVGFFGVAGLTVFTALDRAVGSAGATWCLVEGHPVRRLLQATSVVPQVKRFSTVEDALA